MLTWLKLLLDAALAGLKALAVYGAFKYGRAAEHNEQLEAEHDAAKEHARIEQAVRTASDAELAERMRKYTRQ